MRQTMMMLAAGAAFAIANRRSTAAFAVGLTANDQYKRGASSVNLIGWTAAVTLVLLLLALVRRIV